MRRRLASRRLFSAVAAAVLLACAASGCGSGARETIRIGTFVDCYGPFTAAAEQSAAGAELPFIERGAKPRGPLPTDGIGSVTIAGKRVELVLGCEFYGSYTSTLDAARRLVEQDGVRILVTNSGNVTDEFPTSLYEPRQPGVTFISTALAPSGRQPNVFGVNPDLRQGVAGLGAYAYHKLGWRTAVILGENDPLGWSLAAGFVAEFCSLGGTVERRFWAPITVTNWAPYVRQIPHDVDGVALTAGEQGVASFFKAYGMIQPDLPRHVVMSAVPIALAGARPLGITAAGFLPLVSTAPAWTSYAHALYAAFPAYRGRVGDPADIYANDAVELALTALEQVHGDLSHGEQRFRAALLSVRVHTPTGPLRLDPTHHEIGPNFIIRVERNAKGTLVPATVGVVSNVERTFGGHFTQTSPPDSRTQPICRKGRVPAWAR